MATATSLLDVTNLTVDFDTRRGTVRAVSDVSLTLEKRKILGIVGESGSGKSVTSYAVLKILHQAGKIADGTIKYDGIDVTALDESEMSDIRGREISMIFQNPRAALNPIRRVGHQIEDVLIAHAQAVKSNAKHAAIELLRKVRIVNPEQRYNSYPFELSGGMCQRVLIAIALSCNPRLLIADEPTTGLDVTTQKTIMDLIVDLVREDDMGAILITHDLGLASAYCDEIIVMQDGKVVDSGNTQKLFASPAHDYTRKLIRATPRTTSSLRDLTDVYDGIGASADYEPAKRQSEHILAVTDLVKEFPLDGGTAGFSLGRLLGKKSPEGPEMFRAVDGISFTIEHGESIGLVGESGCGKSTTSSMISRLLDPTSGSIVFDGTEIADVPAQGFAKHKLRSDIQMVFQDPTQSLNPRFTAFQCIADPLRRLGPAMSQDELRAKVDETADQVGLPRDLLPRFPHQLSGGQKARVGIARAVALRPRLLILDEPTSALDVSVQAVVLNLLDDLRGRLGITYIFVSHDLNVVRLLCNRVIVMNKGQIVEQGLSEQVLSTPKDAYTKTLVDAIPHFPS